MFLKPTPIIKSMNKKLQGGPSQQRESLEPLTTNFPDMEFWASHTNNVHDDGDMTALTDQLDQIQIYNDYDEEDDDYGSQDQGYFAGPGGEGLGMGGPLGFVDVKKLKDNIWEMTQQSLKRQAGRDDLDRRWKRKANLEGGDDEDTGETGAGDKDDEQQVITEDQ
ncbi:hypothetical protein BGX29_005701 [Mortierella sp. GBA35]|nr:hypothetical protein BGX29_005701 [Mortierella sp. GBA35]